MQVDGRAIYEDGTYSQWIHIDDVDTGQFSLYLLIQKLYVILKDQGDDYVRNGGMIKSLQLGDASCSACRTPSPVDHFGSSACRSGSLASGGSRSHCTCNACF